MEGDCDFINSSPYHVSSGSMISDFNFNRFDLVAGKYKVSCKAPSFSSSNHFIKLVEEPGESGENDAIIGSNYRNDAAEMKYAELIGFVDITEEKTYQLRHYMASPSASNGLGRDHGSGSMEVYSTCEIEQLLKR